MSPRKVRSVVDVIRGLKVEDAMNQLKFITKWAVKPLEKLINSAVASAAHDFDLEEDNLYIKELKVDDGPTLKRWKPRARGRAAPIRKRTSHITLILGELVESKNKAVKKQKIEAPVKLGEQPKTDKGVKVKDKDTTVKSKVGKKGISKQEEEKGKEIIDPRGEGRGKNNKIEGKSYSSKPGFMSKMFRRKSG